MITPIKKIIPVLLVLAAVTLACSIDAGGPIPKQVPTIPVSADAIQELEDTFSDSFSQANPSEMVSFAVSEQQITSYAAIQLAQNPDSPIQNPQIYLRDGKIDLYAEIKQSMFSANARLSLESSLDSEGKLSFKLTSADLGPIPAPDGLLETLSALIDTTINGSLAQLTTGFKVESVVIADGIMTISGFKR